MMAIFEKGDMWHIWGKTDLFLITTNSTLNSTGELVMGKGIALEAKNRFPILPKLFGKQLLSLRNRRKYHILINEIDENRIGAFQVKYHWNDRADEILIIESAGELFKTIAFNNFKRVDLNFPGIGAGGLPRSIIYPVMYILPDVVHVWEI